MLHYRGFSATAATKVFFFVVKILKKHVELYIRLSFRFFRVPIRGSKTKPYDGLMTHYTRKDKEKTTGSTAV